MWKVTFQPAYSHRFQGLNLPAPWRDLSKYTANQTNPIPIRFSQEKWFEDNFFTMWPSNSPGCNPLDYYVRWVEEENLPGISRFVSWGYKMRLCSLPGRRIIFLPCYPDMWPSNSPGWNPLDYYRKRKRICQEFHKAVSNTESVLLVPSIMHYFYRCFCCMYFSTLILLARPVYIFCDYISM